jgi:hypothetical protein
MQLVLQNILLLKVSEAGVDIDVVVAIGIHADKAPGAAGEIYVSDKNAIRFLRLLEVF